ncbi:hypothetical protein WG628_09720 [Stenotrophomonas maltophilia]
MRTSPHSVSITLEGFQVPVRPAVAMGHGQGFGHRCPQPQHPLGGQRPGPVQRLRQGDTADALHHHRQLAGVFLQRIDRYEGTVRLRGQPLGLVAQPPLARFIAYRELDRDFARQPLIPGQADPTEAPFAQRASDPIVTELLTLPRRGLLHNGVHPHS